MRKALAAAERLHPALLELSPSSRRHWLHGTSQDTRVAANLYGRLAARWPEAGAAYWRTRCWTLQIWQAVYLSVLAQERFGLRPDFRQLTQGVADTAIWGFRHWALGSDCLTPAPVALSEFCRRQHALAANTVPRWPVAQRLLADTVLRAILATARLKPTLPAAAAGRTWLRQMGLPARSSVQETANGLTVRRASCCLDYLRAEGELCGDCPRLKRLPTRQEAEPRLRRGADRGGEDTIHAS